MADKAKKEPIDIEVVALGAFFTGVICIVLAVGIFGLSLAISRAQCEFAPTSKRCIAIENRSEERAARETDSLVFP